MALFDQLISHRFRGFSDRESTMDGLINALDFGVRQIEFDIRMTRCGTPLITHDEAARTEDSTLAKICDVRAAELGLLGGDFAYMPTARKLFEAISAHDNRECQILIDVKDAGFEEMIYALCAEHNLRDRALWVSWLPEVLYALEDIDPEAKKCLSHWCASPDERTHEIHTVYAAENRHIHRPDRNYVHGERSGWFVDGPLKGDLREIVDWVCVPADQISRALVGDYHQDGTKVSAFSYLTSDAIQTAEQRYGHDAFFCDAKQPFEALR
ncbi:MAG: glycerophosphodiester phosphodiesterase family protein [Pseudomonadota bacterium]